MPQSNAEEVITTEDQVVSPVGEAAANKTEIGELEQKLAEAKSQADEYLDRWRRTAAEFANYKKRQERDRSDFTKYANAGLITRLLPILDDFQRALATVPDHLHELTWIEGIALIERKLWSTLEQEGVATIPAEPNQPFDPAIHEALTWEETEDIAEGHIIEQVQQGYKLHERVLRPALVRVAKAVTRPVADEDEKQNKQGEHEE
jgi:molecular chaperone GrpE